MKPRFSIYGFAVFVAFSIVMGCQEDGEKPATFKHEIEGHVQKGPFIIGTTISAFELNSSGQQTGKSFSSLITDNSGQFEFNALSLTSNYVEFAATGFYFDEVKGNISVAPLSLRSLSDVTEINTVNVNILTHLEMPRVEFLVKQHKTFSEAKRIAQSEVLGIFGFAADNMGISESLDISTQTEGNAMLLAISVIIQGNRSVGDLSELLANISNDLAEDGVLNAEIVMDGLRASAKALSLNEIRSNLETRYQDVSIVAVIPNFEKYINAFLSFSGSKPSISTLEVTDIQVRTATATATVIANSLTTDVSFEYGTSTAYGKAVSAAQVAGTANTLVMATLTDLSPGTIYHWRTVATNSKGTTTSSDMTFTAAGMIPAVTTNAASEIRTTAVVVTGTVNPNHLSATVVFEYGTTDSYGQSINATQGTIDGQVNAEVSATLSELVKGTLYHYRIKASNELGESVGSDMTFTADFTLGGKEAGGTIAYILQPGDIGYVAGETHGLVAATGDLSNSVRWHNGTAMTTGSSGTAVGTGFDNTIAIINAQGNSGVYAAKLCRDYRGGGFDDWYLPSKDEVAKLWLNRTAIGGFIGMYWTSTEVDMLDRVDKGAFYHELYDDRDWLFPAEKYATFRVRAVRSF